MKILYNRIRTLLLSAVLISATVSVAEEIAPGVYRSPDHAFAGLPDFPFAPNYLMVDGLRLHYLDEGPRNGQVVLLMHGEPSWSYLYRHMIPVLVAAGHRVIAPDLIGFGRSDKPAQISDHSYQGHVDQIRQFVDQLDLQGITLFVQDWGGLIGLRILAEQPDRFARLVVANTGLPAAEGISGWIGYPLFRLALWRTGTVTWEELQAEPNFVRWAAYSQTVEDMPVGQIVVGDLIESGRADAAVLQAYDAPFPDIRYKAGPLAMPALVPSELRKNAVAWKVLEQWEKPVLTAFSDGDPITRGGELEFQQRMPGARNRTHVTIKGAGHFLQETHGPELAELMLQFMAEQD
jgi:haloalkane dehalogenase